jgi:hypothetical protein
MTILTVPNDLSPSFDPREVEPVISLNSLPDFSTPQTLNLVGYIKNQNVFILIIVEEPIILVFFALLKK